MKKQVILALCLMAAAPAFAGQGSCGGAKNLASPFYMPKQNQWVVQAATSYTRGKVNPWKTWDVSADGTLGYGITDEAEVFVSGGNAWKDWKTGGVSNNDGTNQRWSVGGKYNLFAESFPILATVQYLQERGHGLDRRHGEYKAFAIDVKKDLCPCKTDYYIGGTVELPVFQRSDSDNDPKYTGYAGVFQPWTKWLATDLRAKYNYDSYTKTRLPSVYGEVSVLPLENLAFGVFAEQSVLGKTKNHSNVHQQKVGIEAKVQF
jgi:hypothetical protein